MAQSTPDWLARHYCRLQAEGNGKSYLVLLDHKPQYLLTPIPLRGKFGCAVMETINGRRLDRGGTFATNEEAVAGGLEDLRQALGW